MCSKWQQCLLNAYGYDDAFIKLDGRRLNLFVQHLSRYGIVLVPLNSASVKHWGLAAFYKSTGTIVLQASMSSIVAFERTD